MVFCGKFIVSKANGGFEITSKPLFAFFELGVEGE